MLYYDDCGEKHVDKNDRANTDDEKHSWKPLMIATNGQIISCIFSSTAAPRL